ncbi:hypothetical protein HHI36_013549 [Cryptolaemus montrouzieri]|uniref:Uncharacterized protein n=1 Tax=Cryptolaemus montrouzieri TaxID=559131 RepID=A0ABD2NIL8_9CUCU
MLEDLDFGFEIWFNKTVPTIQDLYKEIVRNRTEIREFIELKILTKIEAIEERVKDVEIENRELRDRIERLERESKWKNIIIFGFDEEASDISSELVCETLNSSLKIDLSGADIADVHPIGKNISISRDVTLQKREKLKTLWEHLAIATKDPRVKSFINGDKLFVVSKSHNVQQLTTFTKKNDECNTEVIGLDGEL